MELSIGRLADAAGVNVETIRYYQRLGLLDQPAKLGGRHRRYPLVTLSRVRFIKRAQGLGFTLTEVADLLALDAVRGCASTRELAIRKVAAIDQKLADLASMRAALIGLVEQCKPGKGTNACPIIAALAQDQVSAAAIST